MREGDKRPARRVVRHDSRDLARLSKKHVLTEAEWDEKVGSGAPKDAAAALISRTATLDDPLTTSLLAEVTRRSMTIDVSPDQIDQIDEIDERGEIDERDERDEREPGARDPSSAPADAPSRDPE